MPLSFFKPRFSDPCEKFVSDFNAMIDQIYTQHKTNQIQYTHNKQSQIIRQLQQFQQTLQSKDSFKRFCNLTSQYDDQLRSLEHEHYEMVLKIEFEILGIIYQRELHHVDTFDIMYNYFLCPFWLTENINILSKMKRDFGMYTMKTDNAAFENPYTQLYDAFEIYKVMSRLRFSKPVYETYVLTDQCETVEILNYSQKNNMEKVWFIKKYNKQTRLEKVKEAFFIPVSWVHGTSTATLVSMSKFLPKECHGLMPSGELMKRGIVPLTGELSVGISARGINQTGISGVHLAECDSAIDYSNYSVKSYRINYKKEKEYLGHNLENFYLDNVQSSRFKKSVLRLKYFGQIDEQVVEMIKIFIGKLNAIMSDNSENEERDILKRQHAEKEIEFMNGIIQEWLNGSNKSIFTDEECKFIGCEDYDKPISLIFGSINPTEMVYLRSDIKGEIGMNGFLKFGEKIQYVFTEKESIKEIEHYMSENIDGDVLVLDICLLKLMKTIEKLINNYIDH